MTDKSTPTVTPDVQAKARQLAETLDKDLITTSKGTFVGYSGEIKLATALQEAFNAGVEASAKVAQNKFSQPSGDTEHDCRIANEISDEILSLKPPDGAK